MAEPIDYEDRLLGALLGVALGDALGLPYEGLSQRRAERSFRPDRFRMLGRGFVSDDTEQTVLIADALLRGRDDDSRCVRAFRSGMRGFLLRLPFGIGWSTLKACVRLLFGVRASGVRSAGNGAAMRAGILGAYLANDAARRVRLGRELAKVTHTDPRAVEGALYVAELTAACVASAEEVERADLVRMARTVITDEDLNAAVDLALQCLADDVSLSVAVTRLGNSGFVVESVGLSTFCFVRFSQRPMDALHASIRAGGDTDTHAAIVGGWVFALHGAEALPRKLVDKLFGGPFGPSHLIRIRDALVASQEAPGWSRVLAGLRNLSLYPVVLTVALFRLFWR